MPLLLPRRAEEARTISGEILMPQECEAKLKVDDLDALRNKLASLGAANEGDCLERNWVLDDASGSLRQRGVLLRVRNMGGAGGVLTVKQPLEGGAFKTREETETMVDSTADLLRQFEILGYRVAWIYEKYRQIWLWSDCVIALDECPEIGSYIEIEGAPDKIRHAALDLGLNPEHHIPDTYLGLWMRHLGKRGGGRRDMLFSKEETEARKNTTRKFSRRK